MKEMPLRGLYEKITKSSTVSELGVSEQQLCCLSAKILLGYSMPLP